MTLSRKVSKKNNTASDAGTGYPATYSVFHADADLSFASCFSGIEATSVAWKNLPYRSVFFAETGDYQSALLRQWYPDVPNLGDVRDLDARRWHRKVDVLWGSPPCQSFSIGGSRRGLNDPRGLLTTTFVHAANKIEPEFLTLENVKGLLHDKDNAFGKILSHIAGSACDLVPPGGRWTDAGYVSGPKRNIAWRVFDAQYGGVAQRRKRLFLIACPRTSPCDPRAVLFEQGSTRRNAPPLREDRPPNPDTAQASPVWSINGDTRPKINLDFTSTLKADVSSGSRCSVLQQGVLRQLSPREWERLFGFPDDYTAIFWRRGGAPATRRRSALGNSMAIPDVRWIGERILAVKRGTLRLDWPREFDPRHANENEVTDGARITCEAAPETKPSATGRVKPKFPTGSYNVVLADPAWRYYDPRAAVSGAHQHYETMSDEEIYALPMKSIMARESVLFLWATSPKLHIAQKAIEAWGLNYRGVAQVWVKERKDGAPLGATGQRPTTVKPTCEFLLVASRRARGRPLALADETISQVMFAPRGRHSEKPLGVIERLERMYPEAKKIELFARAQREGWDAWGNEVPPLASEHVRASRANAVRPAYGSVQEAVRASLSDGCWRGLAELRPHLPACSEGAPYNALKALERQGEVEREEGSSPRRWRLRPPIQGPVKASAAPLYCAHDPRHQGSTCMGSVDWDEPD